MDQILAFVKKDDQTVVVLLKSTDCLDDVEKAIQEAFQADLNDYIIMQKITDGIGKQILTEDHLCRLLSNSKRLELLMERFQPNETSPLDDNGIHLTNSISIITSLPVVQSTEIMTNANLNTKYKKILKLKQHFEATAILTKFFLSEISPNAAGINYLKQHLVKNEMPIPVQEFITNNLIHLVYGTPIISDYKSSTDQKSRKTNGLDEIIIKMKSKILNGQLFVVVGYAIVQNKQRNFVTSCIKKLVPDRKFNKDVDHMLDEWVEEKITSEHLESSHIGQ